MTDKQSSVACTRTGGWTTSVTLGPSHQFKVEEVQIVQVLVSALASEQEHPSSAHNSCRVVEAGRRSSTAGGSLEPSHGNRIKGVKITEALVLFAFATENNDALASKNCRVSVARTG